MQLQKLQRIISPLLTLLVCIILLQTNFFPWLSNVGLDILFKLRGERETSQEIVIVGIDEQSLQEFGGWPFPRQIHARLLGHLHLAKAIAFDLIFSYEELGDDVFSEALSSGPGISFGVASDYYGELLVPPKRLSDHVHLGHIETELGADGVIRKVELFKLGQPVLALTMTKAIEKFKDQPGKSGRLINFYGPEFTFLYISYSDVVAGKYSQDFFKDRYVLVGSKALALGDVHITPFSRRHPVPGVEVQATILNNILEESFLRESWKVVAVVCFLVLILAVVIWPELSEAKNVVLNLGVATAIFLGVLALFHKHFFLNPLLPLFVIFTGYLVHIIVQWAVLTARMVREIRLVNEQLEYGVQTVFKSLPKSFDKTSFYPDSSSLVGPGGLKRHIYRIHKGIQALALQNSFIKHLLSEEAPPFVMWGKESGNVLLANDRFVKLWQGISDSGNDLPNLEDFYELIRLRSTDGTNLNSSIELESGGKHVDRVYDISVREDGRKVHLRIVVNEVNSTILGLEALLAGFTDVTEIRELERLKSEVMNIVSHELKLPLTTIMGFSEMLVDTLNGPEQEYADQIARQSKRLATMIEDFLDIARIESGKYVINRYPFDMLSVIFDGASVVEQKARTNEITIEYDLPAKTTPIIGDESLVTQSVLNLLDNAVKLSPKGGTIKVGLLEEEEWFVLSVEDEGPGVADEEKTRIFEKFIRGLQESRGRGFGLGLSFVKQVVENHGGKVWVEDAAEQGAVFKMSLPKSKH